MRVVWADTNKFDNKAKPLVALREPIMVIF